MFVSNSVDLVLLNLKIKLEWRSIDILGLNCRTKIDRFYGYKQSQQRTQRVYL